MNYFAPKMKTKGDCGLTAMTWAIHKLTGRDYDEIYLELKEIMDYKEVDLDDNPAEHERVITTYSLRKQLENVKFSLVEPIKENLFSGKCPNDATIILVKFPYNQSKYKFINNVITTTRQHWVVLKSIDLENKMIDIWWGDGKYYRFSFDSFEEWIIGGILPNCVYVVGDYTAIRNPWYSRLYAWVVNNVLRIFKR